MDGALKRISEMERALDASADAFSALDAALGLVDGALPDFRRLVGYYTSPRWLADFDADRAGQLPAGLKRGVLSEDAAYDALTDAVRLAAELRELAERLEGAVRGEE